MRELESAPSLLASRVAASTFSAPIPTTQASLKGQAVQKVMGGRGGLTGADGKSGACAGGPPGSSGVPGGPTWRSVKIREE